MERFIALLFILTFIQVSVADCGDYCNKPLSQGKIDPILQKSDDNQFLIFGKQDTLLKLGKEEDTLSFGQADAKLKRGLNDEPLVFRQESTPMNFSELQQLLVFGK
jgi:hypothetical protein